MQIHSLLFTDTPAGSKYERMARVLEYSAAQNSPSTPLTIHRVDDSDDDLRRLWEKRVKRKAQLYLDSTRKMKHWAAIVRRARPGDVLCLLDCDAMVLRDLSDAPALLRSDDVAVTVRPPGCQYGLNSGVLVVRVTANTWQLFDQWYLVTRKLLVDAILHLKWKATWGGISQAAYGWMLDRQWISHCVEWPCEEWNCENDCLRMDRLSENARIVHVNGHLRRVLFSGERPCNASVGSAAKLWRNFDAKAAREAIA